MLIIHFGVEGLPNRVVCDQLECTPQMLTDFNSCWTVDYKVNQFSGLTYAEVRITNHQELMDEVFNGFITCSSQLGLNIETCSELLDLNLNSSDTKYDDCKCFLPCISKILGTMNTDDGKWNEKRYWEIIAMIKVPEWKQEAEVIGNNCKDNVNTHCSAGYPLFQCALKHSKMLQDMANTHMIQKQAIIEAMNRTNVEYEDDNKK